MKIHYYIEIRHLHPTINNQSTQSMWLGKVSLCMLSRWAMLVNANHKREISGPLVLDPGPPIFAFGTFAAMRLGAHTYIDMHPFGLLNAITMTQ